MRKVVSQDKELTMTNKKICSNAKFNALFARKDESGGSR